MTAQSDQTNTPKFSGFGVPEQNWFKMPKEWTNITAEISSLAELKVVEYVLKHTWGYQEFGIPKQITTDEFMKGRKRKDGSRLDKGTGLSKPSVVDGLKRAVKDGYLVEEVDDSDKARVKKSYALRMKDPEQSDGGEEAGVKDLNADVKNLNTGGKVSSHRTEKDTLERHSKKDNNTNSSREMSPKTDVVVALVDMGITEKVAQRLANRYKEARIKEKIDFLQYLQEVEPDQVKKSAPGWLRRAIEDNYAAPAGYALDWRDQQEADIRQQAEAQRQREQWEQQRAVEEAAEREQAIKAREEQLKPLRSHLRTSETEEKIWSSMVNQLTATNETARKIYFAGSEYLGQVDNQYLIWTTSKMAAEQIRIHYEIGLAKLLAKHYNLELPKVQLTILYPNAPEIEQILKTKSSP